MTADQKDGTVNERDDKTGPARKPLWRRIWRFVARPHASFSFGAIALAGIFAGIILWGGFNWSMELTNTETFCISCHEMEQNVFREYQATTHYSNHSGVRATCPHCHVPRPWIHKVVRKIRATNELYHKVLGSIDTREKFEAKRLELAQNVWRAMERTDSRECRNCHDFDSMDFTLQENRAARNHQKAIDEGLTCINCHRGIAHELPEGAFKNQSVSLVD